MRGHTGSQSVFTLGANVDHFPKSWPLCAVPTTNELKGCSSPLLGCTLARDNREDGTSRQGSEHVDFTEGEPQSRALWRLPAPGGSDTKSGTTMVALPGVGMQEQLQLFVDVIEAVLVPT